jgi:hypothetical protein
MMLLLLYEGSAQPMACAVFAQAKGGASGACERVAHPRLGTFRVSLFYLLTRELFRKTTKSGALAENIVWAVTREGKLQSRMSRLLFVAGIICPNRAGVNADLELVMFESNGV